MAEEPNFIERTRVLVGLSRSKMMELIHAEDPDVFTTEDPDPVVMEAARTLSTSWYEFVREKRLALDREFRRPACTMNGQPYLSTMQVSLALGIGDFHVSNLRVREILRATSHGNKTVYDRHTVYALLDEQLPEGRRNSPLIHSFLRYLEDRDYAPPQLQEQIA